MARRRFDVTRSKNGRILQAGDCVTYNGSYTALASRHWRVESFKHRVDEVIKLPMPGDIADQICHDIHMAEREKDRISRVADGLPCNLRYRFLWCFPQHATHVSLYGVCGALAPIEECEFTGVVNWPADLIQDHKRRAIWLVGQDSFDRWHWE